MHHSRSKDTGEHQLTLDFPAPESPPRNDPAIPHRREAAAAVLALTSAPEIRALIERGQLTTGNRVQFCGIERFVRDQRSALRAFVQRIASGNFARDAAHQEKAVALLQHFNTLSDSELAQALKELGLCDSTTSFGKHGQIGSFRYLLFGFRRAMKQTS